MIVIGLTGSIGMGKSTIGTIFKELGVPVHEADGAVHDLLQFGKAGYLSVIKAFSQKEYPQIYKAQNKEGIDRKELGALVFYNDALRERLEKILHPLVCAVQKEFIDEQKKEGRAVVVLDIPLLFETGAEDRVDFTVVVSAPFEIQEQRVLSRSGMTEGKFTAILERQMPDADKCARADYVVNTDCAVIESRKELEKILTNIKEKTS